jgi:hypothetical protein
MKTGDAEYWFAQDNGSIEVSINQGNAAQCQYLTFRS